MADDAQGPFDGVDEAPIGSSDPDEEARKDFEATAPERKELFLRFVAKGFIYLVISGAAFYFVARYYATK